MKNRTLSIVESPLQLLNAIEYTRGQTDVLALSLGSETNESQIRELANLFDLQLVRYKGSFSSYTLSSFFVGIRAVLFAKNYKSIILGDFREWHFQLIVKSRLFRKFNAVLVDDGTNMLAVKNEIRDLKKLGVIVFSAFVDCGKMNNYAYIKSQLRLQRLKEVDIIIGSSVVNRGALDWHHYADALKRIKPNQSRLILYVPHRNEKDELFSLVRISNAQFQRIKLPLELLFMIGYKVMGLYGVSSSAILTLDKIYELESINLVRIGSKWSRSDLGRKMNLIEEDYIKKIENRSFRAPSIIL